MQFGVRPQIEIGYKRGIIYTKARAAVSFSGKAVFLQRLSRYGQWVSIKKIKLNSRSSAAVRVRLPRGLSRLRVSMSVNQAGAGYLAGFSPTLVVRRR